ncbi:TIGR02281 family clan AA aspartic protease [Aurantivibrio plasticivorans]
MNDPAPGQGIGKGMLILGWVLVLAALTMFFANWEENQRNPNAQLTGTSAGGVNEVILKANQQHHYIAPGAINKEPVTLLLDTGATDVAVPGHLADRLGLQAIGKGYANTANGTAEIYFTTIEELTLGSLTFHDLRASISPGIEGDEVLMGMSALRQVEMIQRDGQLILRQYPQ